VVLSGPLLCILIVVLINFLLQMVGMMVLAKRAQLKDRFRKQKAAGEGAVAGEGEGDGAGAGAAAGEGAAASDTKKDK